MTASTRKLLLLLVLVIVWALVWQARLNDWQFFRRAPASVPTHTLPPAVSAPQASIVDDGTAPVLATIAWVDPDNPAAIPLDWRGSLFLFDTRDGLQVWDSAKRSLSPLQGAAADARLIDTAWARAQMELRHGTLFAVRTGPSPGRPLLYWVQSEQQRVGHWLALPADFTPTTLLPVGNDAALVCAKSAGQAMLVRLAKGQLEQLADSPDQEVVNLWKQVKDRLVGPVVGFGEVRDPVAERDSSHTRPLVFDTRDCAWKAKKLPEPLAGAAELEILPRFTNNGAMIAAASWRDAATGQLRTLGTPLLWNWHDDAWRAHKSTELAGVAPARQPGIGDDPWAYAADPVQGRFAFLSATETRWRESTRRLPPADGLKLLPISAEGVLALLIDARHPGRVVRLDPEKDLASDAQFPTSIYDSAAAIPMGAGAMMIVGGGSRDGMVLSPDNPSPDLLPDLPRPGQRHTGVELSDGSVLLFGGLPRDCFSSGLERCGARQRSGFRWMPAEKRWQPVPTLNVPFATGDGFDGGNASIDSSYARNDAALGRGNELYYLGGNETMRSSTTWVEPTTLYRWRLDEGTRALARTRLSRYGVSLIALDDGRLAAVGGSAADETPDAACDGCESAPDRRFDFTRSCETYDPATNQWSWGPKPAYPRGRAVKLANGRIFKLSLLGYNAVDADYAAETADRGLIAWTAAPRFPLPHPATVRLMQAVGNQVIIVMNDPGDRYVLWDDDSRSWQVRPLPPQSNWGLNNKPSFIGPEANGKILLIYERSFEYITWP